jgi:hypothetical protein
VLQDVSCCARNICGFVARYLKGGAVAVEE